MTGVAVTRTIVALALAASAVLLSGCVSLDAPPSEPTATELESFRQEQLDVVWANLGVPADTARPTVPTERLVQPYEKSFVISTCMVKAGYEQYDTSVVGEISLVPRDPTAERLAFYTCTAQYPVDPTAVGYLGATEAGYLYDYFVDWLVPCLGLHGFGVGTAPDRRDFVAAHYKIWNPYQGVLSIIPDDDPVFTECPAEPRQGEKTIVVN